MAASAAAVSSAFVHEMEERHLSWALHWLSELSASQRSCLLRNLQEIDEPSLDQLTSHLGGVSLSDAAALDRNRSEAEVQLILKWYSAWPSSRRQRLLHQLAVLCGDWVTPQLVH